MPIKPHTLSKSDFKLASDCPQKLLYKKKGYPTNNEGNEFLQTLAEGGYIVGKMAQVMYAYYAKQNGYECQEIKTNNQNVSVVEETEKLLRKYDKVILFEPAIVVGQKTIRIDILIKNDLHFSILEVKAKSHSSEDEEEEKSASSQKKKLNDYIEDVAYQKLVFSEWLAKNETDYPNATVTANLLMPDKDKTTQIENLVAWFQVSERIKTNNFNAVVVDFLMEGKEMDLWEMDSLGKSNGILQKLDIDSEVNNKMAEISKKTQYFLDILNEKELFEVESLISKKCFSCEFKHPDDKSKDGYYQCLGKRAYSENHISELYYGGTIGGIKNPLVNYKLKSNKELTIFDFQPEDFADAKGKIGVRNERQIIQIENTMAQTSYFSDEMADELNQWEYPLHFIDFETITCAIPHHKGMRPYETIAFQWSCHTINQPGDAPVHSEWINSEPKFPNFRFAESLMNQIGNVGTPLMWATHENTVLRAILNQLEFAENYQPGYKNETLMTWLLAITKRKDEKNKVINQGRLIDMNAFTLKHFFHPYMKGKTSIKKTLPAVWNHNDYLHTIDYFKPYLKIEKGVILNPYETLKSQIVEEYLDAENDETVKEGSGAMRAYQEMLFGKGKDDLNKRNQLKQELLNYCKLDTMAMVIIWHHWKTHFNIV
jgi:hypothetical protein